MHLVENLYKYKIFFTEEIFDDLHRYKSIVQEFGVLLNELTRPEKNSTSDEDEKINSLIVKQIHGKYDELDSLYISLSKDIRDFVVKKTET